MLTTIKLFAETNLNADSDTFSKLASQGVPGIIIAMIVAFAAMFVICRYLDVRRDEKRELKRDKELTQLKIEENQSRIDLSKTLNQLANNVKEMTFLLVENTQTIKESVSNVDSKVCEVNAGVESIGKKVLEHDKTLSIHGDAIAAHEIHLDQQDQKIELIEKPKTKKRGRSENV